MNDFSAFTFQSEIQTPPVAWRPRELRYFTPWLLVLTGVWLVIFTQCFHEPASSGSA